jgi:hypothetical protein
MFAIEIEVDEASKPLCPEYANLSLLFDMSRVLDCLNCSDIIKAQSAPIPQMKNNPTT